MNNFHALLKPQEIPSNLTHSFSLLNVMKQNKKCQALQEPTEGALCRLLGTASHFCTDFMYRVPVA